MRRDPHSRLLQILAVAASVAAGHGYADGAVTLIGVQCQVDDWFPEFNCIWKDKYYPTSCPVGTAVGCNIHAYLKNTGGSPATVSSVSLVGYNLETVLKLNENVHSARSIYFYWDNPPQDILDAGEPVWYKDDPSGAIPAGGVAQVVVRLRFVPVTNPVNLTIVTSGGTVSPNITVDASAPQLASVGFSQDRTHVYLHWRVAAGTGSAAPATIMMDGTDVTPYATTVDDPNVNYAATVLSLPAALDPMSYHVYQGLYADGKSAAASLRTWVNKFIHGTYNTFDVESNPNYTIADWIAESSDHGINNCQVSVGNVAGYMNTGAGAADCPARGYGYTTGDKTKFDTRGNGPDMFFINDEIDAEDSNMERTFCGTGFKLPCGKSPMGILAMRSIEEGEALRAIRPLTPTSINMNGSYKPENYYAYGQAVDILQVDPYYQRRLQDAYWRDQNTIPVYEEATYIYAVAKAVTRAAEPNPSNVILYSCSWKCTDTDACDPEYVGQIWPFADPETKRIEAYYALAAGAKGLCYWWLNIGWPSMGLGNQSTQAAKDLWKEIGLYGNEIKTIAPQLVISHPADMTLVPSANVWTKALLSGIDTIILLAVNDDYYNDMAGFHHNPVSNATVVATLPSWMTSSPTAFEVRPSGLHDVATSLDGSNLTVSLGTLDITRMIVITTNPQLRATVQQRYEEKVWPGICAFAPQYCVPQNNPPSITQHPSNQTVAPGGSTSFAVGAAGSSPLSYQWQKNQVNLSNGGHYAGCTTATLTVSSVDSGDLANYRCVVSNSYGSVVSDEASLTFNSCIPSAGLQNGDFENWPSGLVAPNWTGAYSETVANQFVRSTSIVRPGGSTLAQGVKARDASGAWAHVYQGFDTNVGDALTILAYAYPTATSSGVNPQIGVNTSSTRPSNWLYTLSTFTKNTWCTIGPIGYTATGATTYLFLDVKRVGAVDTTTYWDDVPVYRAYVPPAPAVGNPASTSLRVDVDPGCNAGNVDAEYAISVGGGGYTLGTHWVQVTGSVGAVAVWQTDTAWATKTVTGLTTDTTYTFQVKARYSSTYTQETSLGIGAVGTPTSVAPTPPTITLHPSDQNVCPGGTVAFNVSATGDAPLSYQWQKNDSDLADGGHYSGVATPRLTVSSADAGDAAGYRCAVSNGSGTAYSNPASLTSKAATAVTQHPQSQTVPPGGVASFTAAATGEGTIGYQWQKNSISLADGGHYSGVTTAVLTVSSADSSDAADYRCVVTAGCGSENSNTATLTVGTAPVPGDFDHDEDVDQEDFGHLQHCLNTAGAPTDPDCADANLDQDSSDNVDQADILVFLECVTGPGVPGNPNCAN
jgi:hypothetical protein